MTLEIRTLVEITNHLAQTDKIGLIMRMIKEDKKSMIKVAKFATEHVKLLLTALLIENIHMCTNCDMRFVNNVDGRQKLYEHLQRTHKFNTVKARAVVDQQNNILNGVQQSYVNSIKSMTGNNVKITDTHGPFTKPV